MKNTRRDFLKSVSMLTASMALPISSFGFGLENNRKLKVALIGTGIRGTTFWGKRLVNEYSDILELSVLRFQILRRWLPKQNQIW
jgi:hypothetical protein